jgi:energy-coupling factor transporter ATP-binding protein EcfA2
MKQRVGIARALAMKPKVLLMDEPFGALDALTRAHLQDSVMQIQQALNTTIVLITHDVDEAVLLSDRVLMMTNGPAATVGRSCTLICRARVTGCSWRTTAAITTCASRSSISSMKNSRKRRNEGALMRLVIIGNGMAATRLIASLTGRAAGRFAITVIGDEPEHAYNRIQLSPVLGGEKRRGSVCRMTTGTRHGRDGAAGRKGARRGCGRAEVQTTARTLGWDELVFATGSTPFVPPLPAAMRRMFSRSAPWRIPGPFWRSPVRRWCWAAACSGLRRRRRCALR